MASSTKADPTAFSETDIRPDELRERQRAAYERDITRILRRKAEFVDVACPGCGSNEGDLEFEKFSLAFLRCPACGTVYQSPRPTPEILDYYYSTSENYAFWNTFIFPRSEEVRREKIFRPRLNRLLDICQRHDVRRKMLVDVGAGFGTFGELALSSGAFDHVTAIEPTPDLATACRDRGLDVFAEPVEKMRESAVDADVVTAFEVIEHVFDPVQFTDSCRKMLVVGGFLVLTCPNIDGFDISVLREASDVIDFEHLNYFNPTSLATLLSSGGFDVLEVETPGVLDAELVRKAILRRDIDLDHDAFLRRILVKEWDAVGAHFQEFLQKARLSSHMWIVARRIA